MIKIKCKCSHCGKTRTYNLNDFYNLDDVNCKVCLKSSNLFEVKK